MNRRETGIFILGGALALLLAGLPVAALVALGLSLLAWEERS